MELHMHIPSTSLALTILAFEIKRTNSMQCLDCNAQVSEEESAYCPLKNPCQVKGRLAQHQARGIVIPGIGLRMYADLAALQRAHKSLQEGKHSTEWSFHIIKSSHRQHLLLLEAQLLSGSGQLIT